MGYQAASSARGQQGKDSPGNGPALVPMLAAPMRDLLQNRSLPPDARLRLAKAFATFARKMPLHKFSAKVRATRWLA